MISEEEYVFILIAFFKCINSFFQKKKKKSEKIIFVRDATGHYVVCFDPLDGSSNIDVNVNYFSSFNLIREKNKNDSIFFKKITDFNWNHLCYLSFG